MADLDFNDNGCGDQLTFTLTEYPDKKIIKNIFRHPDIYDTDRKRIRKYCDNVKDKGIKIKYSKKSKYGRYYPVDGSMISATYMWRRLRSTLFSDTEYDIDIKSCHFQILINEVKDKLELENLQDLINNRDEYFKSFLINEDAIKSYNNENNTEWTKKDLIKKLLSRILYGGLYTNWLKEFNFNEDDIQVPEWFYKINEDIKQGIAVLMKIEKIKKVNDPEYTNMFDDIKLDILSTEKEEWDKEQIELCKKDKRRKPKPFNPNDFNVAQPKIIARYFQEKESNIIDKVYDYIKKKYKIRPTAYCYDGLQFRKSDITEINRFLLDINEHFDVVFENKSFDEKLTDVPNYVKNDFFEVKEFNMMEGLTREYYFNSYYFKIHSLNGMCYINEKGHLTPIKNNTSHFAKIYDFWNEYQWSQNIIEYFGAGIYPNRDLCPKQIYNMWKGFEVEHYEDYEKVDISVILDHFNVVANYDEKVYNYLLNYFAHLIQKPHIKTGVCILVQGKQGTGKTTLFEILLRKIMGKRYVYDTADVEKIVGRFNGNIAGKLMVVLNEASGKDNNQVLDKIKDIVTRTEVTIEHKGIDPFEVEDYCNYCFTTNNIKPVAVTSDDRRFQVIECSDKYKGDTEYFKKLYNYINDKPTIYTFYKYLLEKDISNFNPEADRVVTDATKDLHVLNQEPVEMFLDYLHSEEYKKYERKMRTKELYDIYKKFMYEVGYKNVCPLPTFNKLIKDYQGKRNYQYEIIYPGNVATIKFKWEIECMIDPE